MVIPDHETSVDFLNYEAIAGTVVELLRDSRQKALTVGIHGDWGAGKSSILKMIEREMAEDDRVACLWFNGWAFQGFDDAKTVLIEATISELCRQKSGVGKVKELGARLIGRIDWLKVLRRGGGVAFTLATGLPSPDQIETVISSLRSVAKNASSLTPEQIEAGLTEAQEFLKPAKDKSVPEEIHQFREEFKELLDEAKIDQLVVLIDDLDRCLPATAIDTLEAIRLFLFVPKTAFVIGADEAMIEYAVRHHFPDLPQVTGPPYARNYLEKLIQVPFRVPALGIQETKTYVTLLLIENLMGEGHAGFQTLLAKARQSLNQPWIGSGLSPQDVRAVDAARQPELDAQFFLAQQIGPILAEGTKGNPRQVKRFLNALLIRQAIARARGFSHAVNQSVLAKLMLAERFQHDFYDHLAGRIMIAKDGQSTEIAALERNRGAGNQKPRSTRKKASPREDGATLDSDLAQWAERDWVQRWAGIDPSLSGLDLRPYVFVARDKRMLTAAAELGGLESLIERLAGSDLVVRSAEPEVRALTPADAEQVFNALRDRVIRAGDFRAEPSGFTGLGIVAKHHVRHQAELIDILRNLDSGSLGPWVVRGWGEVITEPSTRTTLRTQVEAWAAQNDNGPLKKAAEAALPALRAGGAA